MAQGGGDDLSGGEYEDYLDFYEDGWGGAHYFGEDSDEEDDLTGHGGGHHFGLNPLDAFVAALGGRRTREGNSNSSSPPPLEDETGGYDLKFISEVPDSLQCLICTLPAKNPQQVDCCGKVFCKSCLKKLKKSYNKVCPNCRDRNWKSFPDKKSDRDIQFMKVKCSNSEGGCTWEGELRELDKHIIKCTGELHACKYASVGCKIKVVRSKLAAHEESCTAEHLRMALKKVESLTTQLKEMELKLAASNPSDKTLPPPQRIQTPPVVFKMTNFSGYISQVLGRWDTPPVYTHPEGYKFYLQVTTAAQAVSVHAYLMHGEHDDTLIWPFRGVVNFKVLNQDTDLKHKVGQAKFMQQRPTEKNRKVTAGQAKSLHGWGVNNILKQSDSDFPSYIRRNTLYLQVSSIDVFPDNKPWLL